MTDLSILLAIDALDAGDMRAFVTQTAEPAVGLSINVEIRDGCVLRSICGYGETLTDALADLWRQLTVLEDSRQYLVIRAGTEKRRAVRWNGHGFKPHYEPERAEVAA